MKFVVSNSQMKSAERLSDARALSYSRLMKNAGSAAARHILCLAAASAPAAVLCGSGNNGGDGFVIARVLLDNGFDTRVILANGAPKTDIAREYLAYLPSDIIADYRSDKSRCVDILRTSGTVCDCVFGTGFHGELPADIAELFSLVPENSLKISVDVPSGVNSDTGEFCADCFRPAETLVLAAMKTGLINPACVDVLGKISLLDIDISDDCYEEYEAIIPDLCAEEIFPARKPSANKGTYGRLLNIAGSLCYSGAAALSTKAALRAGAGLCTLAAPVSAVEIVGAAVHETTYLPLPETPDGFIAENCAEKLAEILPKMNAVSVGCGLGNSKNTFELTKFVIKNADCPIIIDADGINSLAGNINILKERTSAGRKTVLTPHPLEFSRISGRSVAEIQRDRLAAAKAFSRETGAVVLLKGAFTVVADGGEAFVNPTGCAGLAKGGSGDVLTGIIAALLAQGVEARAAAVGGAYIHGLCADRLAERMSMRAILPGDLIEELGAV